MQLIENVPLSTLTTFKVGGNAQYVAACENEEDIETAITFADDRGLPWYVIGGGSNILVSDEGYAGVIIRPVLKELFFEEHVNESVRSNECIVTAGAGIVWDKLVQESVERGLWGLENLAGIPGLVGGAPVQNIGAYGADVSDTLLYVDVFDTTHYTNVRLTKEECAFAYRESRFKHDPSLIILRAAFVLSYDGTPHISYADLTAYQEAARTEAGNPAKDVLDTPLAIATAVRIIRSRKFPDLQIAGTAGSFFKNPIISLEKYESLKAIYPELPGFPMNDPSSENTSAGRPEMIKIPLAWILDHVLQLRGFSKGPARLFERQPLVLTTNIGATAEDIESLAREVEDLVKEKIDIIIEREVRML